MLVFFIILLIVSAVAGVIASIAGFGIGSLLTPVFSSKCEISLAVAAVSIAHFLGTASRFWKWKKYVNKQVLWSFGITSAFGGLIGALFHNIFQNAVLTVIFGCLLIFAGVMGLSGLSEKMRFNGVAAWMAGALSGVFGGLVGNQGGIRSAAMLGFDLTGKEFVATATGIALVVDMARMPVYLFTQSAELFKIWFWIVIASAGVLIGTEIGIRLAEKISVKIFKKVVSGIVFAIGVFVLMKG